MDRYYGINDFLVPEDQDLFDRLPSPESWSKWGTNAPEGFGSPKKLFIMDTSAKDMEFNFMDESFSNEIELEPSLHDKDQSSSSSACGGLLQQSFQQKALSCDQPNYQLQDLSSFGHMDDIFLYKHNLELYKHEPVIAWDSVLEDLSGVEDQHKSFYFCPENPCSNTPGGLQKDFEASKFVPCNSNSKHCLDIECNSDEAMHEQLSLEESIMQNLEIVIEQFTEKTRICFRDALYRLARNTKQQHVVENLDGSLNMQKAFPNETMTSDEDKKPMESETNSVDRAVANLMFNKMQINAQDHSRTSSINSNQEVIGRSSSKWLLKSLESGTNRC